MKNILFLLILLVSSATVQAQSLGYDLFGVNTNPKAGPYAIMTLDTLRGAQTIHDIYARFPSKWVKTYRHVEISIRSEDREVSAITLNDTLSQEQLRMFADFEGKGVVNISIDYIPKNNLTKNPPRKEEFWLTWIPIYEAKYPGGESRLEEELKKIVSEELQEETWSNTGLVSIKFTVDENGTMVLPQIVCSSTDDEMDKIILSSIKKLETWTPAINHAGKAISQEFEFRMGTDLMRCDYKY